MLLMNKFMNNKTKKKKKLKLVYMLCNKFDMGLNNLVFVWKEILTFCCI